jgi:SAM-dependent methyltransferase
MADRAQPLEETVNNPFFARMYLRMASGAKGHAEDEQRRRLLTGLRGRVIELGAGNGLNFPFYPDTVDEVLAVEPEPLFRKAAIENARKAPVPVQVVDAVSGRLPAEDASFDAAVSSLVLCSVPDQDRALAELFRVVRPGGELHFYEHVIAHRPLAKGLQRIADATFWPRVAGGCHLTRDTGAAIERAGFVVETTERFTFSSGAPVPPIPHILGTARRP